MSRQSDPASLASVAHDAARDWNLAIGAPFAQSQYSFVAPAGDAAVIKVRPPEDDESDEEDEALEFWGGDGAVRLLRRDPSRRAMLIERAVPGTDISLLPETEATAIAVGVGLRLWRRAQAPFRWIGDHVPRWLDEAERGATIDPALIRDARAIYRPLSVGRTVLVHGDFHHHNILDAGDRYVAIDPKPMLGEPEFDVPPFLWNPTGYQMSQDVTEQRLAVFATAGLDQERMRAWSVIRGAYLGADDDVVEILRSLI
jgi:streptomycin 6-kinase